MWSVKLRRIWLLIRRSPWSPAIAAIVPNIAISFAWNYGDRGSLTGFFASFVAIELLIVLVLTMSRPLLQVRHLFEQEGFIEVDTPKAKILVSRIRAETPPTELAEECAHAFPKLRDAWVGLQQEVENALGVNALTPESLCTVTDTLVSASSQVRIGRGFDILSMKAAACYLGHKEAQRVTRVLVVNRITPSLWFTPEMIIYFFELFRQARDHPGGPQFTRIALLEEDEWRRVREREWVVSPQVDHLKAFVALNQMASVTLKGIRRRDFSDAMERFIVANKTRIGNVDGVATEDLKEFIRDAAFLMYCDDDQPVKVFRGRPYLRRSAPGQSAQHIVVFPEIANVAECSLYYGLFAALDKRATLLPEVNLARTSW